MYEELEEKTIDRDNLHLSFQTNGPALILNKAKQTSL